MREDVLNKLSELEINYELDEHEAAFTIDDMIKFGLTNKGCVIKNLFLRDYKGKRHFLVLLHTNKHADLKSLGEKINARLSFASEERLNKYMKLTKGSVTALGLMNDLDHKVEVIIDEDLTRENKLGVHPCENTATVWISWQDLNKFINHCGHQIKFLKI